jgi:hypothetical protein
MARRQVGQEGSLMASDRFVIDSPRYLGSDSKDMTVTAGGAPTAIAMTVGTYPGTPYILDELEDKLKGVHASFEVTMDASNPMHIRIANAAQNFDLTWNDTLLRDRLGYTANFVNIAGATASYTPLHTWFPDKVRADRNNWTFDQGISKRVEVGTGATPGVTIGDETWRLSFSIHAEPVENLMRSRATTIAERNRSLEAFMFGGTTLMPVGCLHSWPGDSGEPSPAGFYFWPDYSDLGELSSMDEGSAEDFYLTSGASTYCFAQFDDDFVADFKEALSVGRTHYTIECRIHTVSTAPYGGGSWVTLP